MIEGLPSVPSTAIPRGVDKPTYEAALGFEQVLLGELAEQMLPEIEGPHAAHVQEAFASSLVAAGGLGLAAQLYPTLKESR